MIILIAGCAHKEGVIQSRDISYLSFIKSASKTYTVTINNKETFILNECIEPCNKSSQDTLYEIDSGKILIKVTDGNHKLVLEKNVYIGSSNTMEIKLP